MIFDMKVLLPNSETSARFYSEIEKIDHWSLTIPSKESGQYDSVLSTFWIGNSHDGRVWALMIDNEDLEDNEDSSDRDIVAALINPPKRSPNPIAEILLQVFSSLNPDGKINDKNKIDEIISSVEFPVYKLVSDFLSSPPKSWGDIPCELVVGFELSEGACVYEAIFKSYRRNSFHEALEVLNGPRHDGILIQYSLKAREVTPLLTWDIDWPLMRRGKEVPIERTKVQGDYPWEYEADDTLACIYQHVFSRSAWTTGTPYFGEPNIRMLTGGISPEDAIKNWTSCASFFRTTLKSFKEMVPDDEKKHP